MDDNNTKSQELAATLRRLGSPRTLKPDEVLCRENDDSADVFLVESGAIEAIIEGPSGAIVVATHRAGALLGEMAAVIGGRRTATLIAREASTIVVVPAAAFVQVLDGVPAHAGQVLAAARDRAERTRVATHLAASINSSDGDTIAQIADRVTWRVLQAGDTLFCAGDVSDGAYLLTAGRVRVHLPEDDRTVDIGRGEMVGESGLIAGQTRAGTVTALRDCTLARLSADDFRTLMHENTDLAVGLVARVFTRPADAPRVSRPARLVALVHLEDTHLDASGEFRSAMQAVGTTVHMSPESVRATLGTSIADLGQSNELDELRLTELFHHAEFNYDQVLLESADVDSAWTRRILRQADQVVVVVAAGFRGEVGDRLRRLRDNLPNDVPVWLMQVHPAGTTKPSGTPRLLDTYPIDEVHHVRRGSVSDVGRVARLASGSGTGLVLSGGGARGFAHLGVVQALEELGVAIDRIAGASMGSILAAAVAQEVPPGDRIPILQKQVTNLLDYTLPVVSLIKAERISTVLTEQFGTWDLTDLWIPMACVSTNLTTSGIMVHRRGPTERAIRASVSIPGVLPPVVHDGDLLVDGGILNNLPVDVLADDPSVATIIASDVTPPRGPRAKTDPGLSMSGWHALRTKLRRGGGDSHQSLGAVLMRSMLLGSTRERDHAVASGVIDLYLDLDLRGIGLLEFETVAVAAERGYEAARDRVAEWAEENAKRPLAHG